MKIIAHRGASYDAPENTAAAARRAWQEGADGLELDVHLSRDRRVVLLHDANTRRTTGHDAEVAALTWAELQRLDAGSWKGTAWRGERIPALDDLLRTVPEGKRVYVEIKCGPAVVEPLLDTVGGSGLDADRVVLMGEFLATMKPVRKAFPAHACYWIVNLRTREPARHLAQDLVRAASSAGLNGLGLSCCELLDEGFVAPIRKAGQDLFVWTVDEAGEARRMRDLGVDSLATNRPAWIRRQLAKTEHRTPNPEP